MKRDSTKTVIAAVAGLYFLWCAYDPARWHLIDGVNLVIHEAGHVVLMPFGGLLTIAGGSLFQVVVPAVFVESRFMRVLLPKFKPLSTSVLLRPFSPAPVARDLITLGRRLRELHMPRAASAARYAPTKR